MFALKVSKSNPFCPNCFILNVLYASRSFDPQNWWQPKQSVSALSASNRTDSFRLPKKWLHCILDDSCSVGGSYRPHLTHFQLSRVLIYRLNILSALSIRIVPNILLNPREILVILVFIVAAPNLSIFAVIKFTFKNTCGKPLAILQDSLSSNA